jgi:hypothetical protein
VPLEGGVDVVASALARALAADVLPPEEKVRLRARRFSTESTLARLRVLLDGLEPPVASANTGGHP